MPLDPDEKRWVASSHTLPAPRRLPGHGLRWRGHRRRSAHRRLAREQLLGSADVLIGGCAQRGGCGDIRGCAAA